MQPSLRSKWKDYSRKAYSSLPHIDDAILLWTAYARRSYTMLLHLSLNIEQDKRSKLWISEVALLWTQMITWMVPVWFIVNLIVLMWEGRGAEGGLSARIKWRMIQFCPNFQHVITTSEGLVINNSVNLSHSSYSFILLFTHWQAKKLVCCIFLKFI